MFIKKIKNFDKSIGEADIILSDGKYELLCYCFQIEADNAKTEIKELAAFLSDNIMKSMTKVFDVRKNENYYSYHLQGKVIDLDEPSVCIGELKIILDKSFPGDIKVGDFVEFDVCRVDCII